MAIVTVFFFANSFTTLEYNMSLWSYLRGDAWLTEEERAYLKDHGDLIYGADQNSPPLRYVNPQTGQYEGLVIDYLAALSMELGVNISTKPMVWNDALSALAQGKTDFCDLYASKERSKLYLFTSPIYYQRGAVLVRRNNDMTKAPIRSKEDLEGRTIAAIEGDYVFEYLKENFKQVSTVATQDTHSAIMLLKEGNVEAVLGDESVLSYYLTAEQLSSEFILLSDYLYEREAVLGVKKGEETLAAILNKAIYRLNRQNTMNRIYEKWFLDAPLITKNQGTSKALLMIEMVLALGILCAAGLYYWNRQLSREVIRQTEELSKSHAELENAFLEYKLAERRMLQSSKMASIGQLAAGIAHEIRTPLGIIRNATYLIKRTQTSSYDPEIGREHLVKQVDMIDQSVERANKIIDNLLNFSRISDDRLEVIPLRAFVESLWQLNHKAWKSQGVDFNLSCEEELSFYGYQESLKHILLNLFSNAVDAMPKGGQLFVSIQEDFFKGLVTIQVSDTGVGISPQALEHLFDPFFTTKPLGQGTGLGLYIAYNEVQKLGGQITVTSREDSGSHFVIELPKRSSLGV